MAYPGSFASFACVLVMLCSGGLTLFVLIGATSTVVNLNKKKK